MPKVIEDFGSASPNPQAAIPVKSVDTEEPVTIVVKAGPAEKGEGFHQTPMQCLGETGCELFCCIIFLGIPAVASFYICFWNLVQPGWLGLFAMIYFLGLVACTLSGCVCCWSTLYMSRKKRTEAWQAGEKNQMRAGFIHPTEQSDYPDYEKIEWIAGGIRCGENCAILPRHWPAAHPGAPCGKKELMGVFCFWATVALVILGLCSWRLTKVFPIKYKEAGNYLFLTAAYFSAAFSLICLIRFMQLVCLHCCGVQDEFEHIPVDNEKWYLSGKKWKKRLTPAEKKKRKLQRKQKQFENRRARAAWLALEPKPGATKEARAAWKAMEPKRGHLKQNRSVLEPGQPGANDLMVPPGHPGVAYTSSTYLEVGYTTTEVGTEGGVVGTTTEGGEGKASAPSLLSGYLGGTESEQIEGEGTKMDLENPRRDVETSMGVPNDVAY